MNLVLYTYMNILNIKASWIHSTNDIPSIKISLILHHPIMKLFISLSVDYFQYSRTNSICWRMPSFKKKLMQWNAEYWNKHSQRFFFIHCASKSVKRLFITYKIEQYIIVIIGYNSTRVSKKWRKSRGIFRLSSVQDTEFARRWAVLEIIQCVHIFYIYLLKYLV